MHCDQLLTYDDFAGTQRERGVGSNRRRPRCCGEQQANSRQFTKGVHQDNITEHARTDRLIRQSSCAFVAGYLFKGVSQRVACLPASRRYGIRRSTPQRVQGEGGTPCIARLHVTWRRVQIAVADNGRPLASLTMDGRCRTFRRAVSAS